MQPWAVCCWAVSSPPLCFSPWPLSTTGLITSQLATCPCNWLLTPDERFGNSKCCRAPFLLNQALAWLLQNQRLPDPNLTETIPGAGEAARSKNAPETFTIHCRLYSFRLPPAPPAPTGLSRERERHHVVRKRDNWVTSCNYKLQTEINNQYLYKCG